MGAAFARPTKGSSSAWLSSCKGRASGVYGCMWRYSLQAPHVLDALLPVYIESRIFNAMLQSSASEHAARQRAMKSASDNADKLIRDYTRLANNARQSEITQQISEIVGGADALTPAR